MKNGLDTFTMSCHKALLASTLERALYGTHAVVSYEFTRDTHSSLAQGHSQHAIDEEPNSAPQLNKFTFAFAYNKLTAPIVL